MLYLVTYVSILEDTVYCKNQYELVFPVSSLLSLSCYFMLTLYHSCMRCSRGCLGFPAELPRAPQGSTELPREPHRGPQGFSGSSPRYPKAPQGAPQGPKSSPGSSLRGPQGPPGNLRWSVQGCRIQSLVTHRSYKHIYIYAPFIYIYTYTHIHIQKKIYVIIYI